MRQLETAAVLLVLALHTVASQDVVITSVWPSQGSLAGKHLAPLLEVMTTTSHAG